MKQLRNCTLFVLLVLGACKTGDTTTGGEKGNNPSATARSVPKVVPAEKLQQQAWYIDASREKMLGNYPEAIALYEKCLQADPKNWAAHYEIAGIYSKRAQQGLALPHAQAAAEADPKNSWYQQLYAHVLQQNYKFNEAVTVLQKLNKTFPGKPEFLATLAEAQLYAEKPDDALKTYEALEKLTGPSEGLLLQKLKILDRKGDKVRTEETLNALIALNPTEQRYYNMLGDYYQRNGKPDKAVEVYNRLLLVDPDNGFVHLSLSDYYRQQKDDVRAFSEMVAGFEEPGVDVDTKVKILLNYYYAIDNPQLPGREKFVFESDSLCRVLVRIHPDEAKAFAVYGDFLTRFNKLTESREIYRKALELDKSRFAIWNEVLLLNSRLNDSETQLKDARQAIELFPDQPTPYFFYGAALSQQNNYRDAVSNLQTGAAFVVDNNPLLTQFYAALGEAYNGLKEFPKSDDYFARALALDPDNAYVLNNYSYFLSIRNEKLEEAEKMAAKATRLDPLNPSNMDTYGWVFYRLGNFDSAKEWIEKAIAIDTKNGTLFEHLGDVLFRLGDTEKALENWRKAKSYGGGSELLDKKINEKKLYE